MAGTYLMVKYFDVSNETEQITPSFFMNSLFVSK